MTFTVVLVPFDNSKPLESHDVSFDEDDEDFIEKFNVLIDAADEHRHKAMDVLMMPLVRPQEGSYLQPEIPGLFAYYHKDFSEHDERQGQALSKANIRATRLAMACGLLSIRFYGNVLLVRSRSALGGDKRWENLKVSDLIGPCCISPDLRHDIQEQIVELLPANDDLESRTMVPDWIAGAAQQNYHDAAAMAQLASVMNLSGDQQQNNDCDEEADSGTDSDGSDQDDETGGHSGKEQVSHISLSVSDENQQSRTFVTKRPLCLHCRGLSSRLCQDCDGAYFCEPPRTCRDIGWSHSCLCPTWKLYTNRRHELSTFEFLGDWQLPLVGRSFQTSEDPFEEFLTTYIGIVDTSSCTSWWRTELGGWSGGQSDSASSVDATIRRSYSEGFAPLDTSMIPPHRRVTTSDFFVAGLPDRKNSVGFSVLSGGWHDYYKLRGILNSSPVALLCTFPMTIYHAIVQYGEVPATVATMLKRPLRIHVVGAEKELNCLDLFAEIGFLLPEDFKVNSGIDCACRFALRCGALVCVLNHVLMFICWCLE